MIARRRRPPPGAGIRASLNPWENRLNVKAFFTRPEVRHEGYLEFPPLFNADAKVVQRMSPLLQRGMVVDPQPASARLIGRAVIDEDDFVPDARQRSDQLRLQDRHIFFFVKERHYD